MNLTDKAHRPKPLVDFCDHGAPDYMSLQHEAQSRCVCNDELRDPHGIYKGIWHNPACPVKAVLDGKRYVLFRCSGVPFDIRRTDAARAGEAPSIYQPELATIGGSQVAVQPVNITKDFVAGCPVATQIAHTFMPPSPRDVLPPADRWVVSCSNLAAPTVRNTCFLPMTLVEALGTGVPALTPRRRQPNLTPADMLEIDALTKEGMTVARVAELLGASYQQIYNAIHTGRVAEIVAQVAGGHTPTQTTFEVITETEPEVGE